jgi:hypothetical protein
VELGDIGVAYGLRVDVGYVVQDVGGGYGINRRRKDADILVRDRLAELRQQNELGFRILFGVGPFYRIVNGSRDKRIRVFPARQLRKQFGRRGYKRIIDAQVLHRAH